MDNKKIDYYIGIDPDVDLNGFAVWSPENKELELYKKTFIEVLEDLDAWICNIHVIIEAGWLIKKSNWHGAKNKNIASKIGKNVGSNHQVGKCISQYCEYKNIPFTLVKPQGKLNAEKFKKVTNFKGRTNSEMRDAGMLVFGR